VGEQSTGNRHLLLFIVVVVAVGRPDIALRMVRHVDDLLSKKKTWGRMVGPEKKQRELPV